MSNQELDNLFKNKLETLQKQPSNTVWDKIKANTKQKRKQSARWYPRIAAAVVLLATFAGFWLNYVEHSRQSTEISRQSAADSQQLVTAEKLVPKNQEPVTSDHKQGTSRQSAIGNQQFITAEDLVPKNHAPVTSDQKPGTNRQSPVSSQQSVTAEELVPKNQVPVTSDQEQGTSLRSAVGRRQLATVEKEAPRHQQQETSDQNPESSTLIFDIEDFDAKIAKTTTDESIEDKEGQRSSLKKVMDFAKNIKEIDGGLGDLREAKNNLFALNFNNENNNSK